MSTNDETKPKRADSAPETGAQRDAKATETGAGTDGPGKPGQAVSGALTAPTQAAHTDYVPTMTDPNRTWGDQSDANEGDTDTEEKTAADPSNAITEADEANMKEAEKLAKEGKL